MKAYKPNVIQDFSEKLIGLRLSSTNYRAMQVILNIIHIINELILLLLMMTGVRSRDCIAARGHLAIRARIDNEGHRPWGVDDERILPEGAPTKGCGEHLPHERQAQTTQVSQITNYPSFFVMYNITLLNLQCESSA